MLDLFLFREFLGGGVGDFDVGEFFLADGADGVGICFCERDVSQWLVL